MKDRKEYYKNYYLKNKSAIKIKRIEYVKVYKNTDWYKQYRKKFPKKDSGLYTKYTGMVARCNYPSAKGYAYYGGKNLKVEWVKYKDFKNDMYESYLEHIKAYGRHETTIDRIDNNLNYCKNNCRWATRQEQANNKKPRQYHSKIGNYVIYAK